MSSTRFGAACRSFLLAGLTLLANAPLGAAEPTPQQRAAMLREWLQASQMQMRNYQWIETTNVSVDGEQKSSEQKRCYYDVTGALQKIPVAEQQAEAPSGPLRRRIAERKKEELTDYIQSAVALVHAYVPPSPDTIQQAIRAGNLSVQALVPGQKVQLDFANYIKQGDQLGVVIALATNQLLGLSVSSYDDQSNAVTLSVTMSVLPDGTMYAQHSELDAPAKNVVVTVDNTGYQRVAP